MEHLRNQCPRKRPRGHAEVPGLNCRTMATKLTSIAAALSKPSSPRNTSPASEVIEKPLLSAMINPPPYKDLDYYPPQVQDDHEMAKRSGSNKPPERGLLLHGLVGSTGFSKTGNVESERYRAAVYRFILGCVSKKLPSPLPETAYGPLKTAAGLETQCIGDG